MRNVGTIPGSKLLLSWLEEAGFSNAGIVDISKTTSREQRKTDWMTFESLEDFLDPNDSDKTIEGHPAPIRAVVLAQK
jgi:tRNA (mo5U34)-methyltransferase